MFNTNLPYFGSKLLIYFLRCVWCQIVMSVVGWWSDTTDFWLLSFVSDESHRSKRERCRKERERERGMVVSQFIFFFYKCFRTHETWRLLFTDAGFAWVWVCCGAVRHVSLFVWLKVCASGTRRQVRAVRFRAL